MFGGPWKSTIAPLPDDRNEADAEAVAAILRAMRVAEPAARARGIERPAPTADHAVLAPALADGIGRKGVGIRAMPVLHPFPHVARHVEEAPRVGGKPADRG